MESFIININNTNNQTIFDVNKLINTTSTKLNNFLITNNYYYFTDQLKHDNTNTVKFPPRIDSSYPFKSASDDFKLRILLDGNYHIIYNDFYINNGRFGIYDDTNGIELFVINLDNQTQWTPITINAVVPISVDDGFNHTDIKLELIGVNCIFDGSGYSTFYIRYLHP